MRNILNRIVSITELRRNFGVITENLAKIESLIITKGGEPFAILKATLNTKKKILDKARGSWENTSLDDDELWKAVFKKKSRRDKVVL
jgi:hypothetical protein